MAFKSEDSGKWKVFMILAAQSPDELRGANAIANLSGVKLDTVETYLKDFHRIIPYHVRQEGKPPLYSFRFDGLSADAVYKKVKDYYNEKSRNKRKKKDPPEQTDFVKGRTPGEPTFTAPLPEEDKKIEGVGYLKKEVGDGGPLMQMVPVTDLNEVRVLAMNILNPIVAFRFDQVELYHNVIREQQRHAKAILAVLGSTPVNE